MVRIYIQIFGVDVALFFNIYSYDYTGSSEFTLAYHKASFNPSPAEAGYVLLLQTV